jgi:DNA-binding transcriptional LysR family regulator
LVGVTVDHAFSRLYIVPPRYPDVRVEMLVLPFSTPQFTVSLLWRPRLDVDPAHRGLLDRVQKAVLSAVE